MSEERIVSPIGKNKVNATSLSLRETKIDIEPENKLITLSWEKMNVWTPSEFSGYMGDVKKKVCFYKKETPPKNIIKNVSGLARPGSMMAIMGASGAGKTTLLNILNFRNRGNLVISGDVKINGEVIKSAAQLAGISGYVQQDDLFIATLKVKEQLRFQAMLKMDGSLTNEQKMQRVEEIMLELNLKKCEDTVIGSAEKHIKGISGGEKRRLGFACELITNPNLLFCDEPTSGLDAYMAMSVVECMQKLAQKGKTIVCTIHQPSSEIFSKFDRLCLLAEGRLAFIGDLKEATKFFANNGYNVPQSYNPADFYIYTLAVVSINREECLERVDKVCNNFLASSYNETLEKELADINQESNFPKLNIFKISKIEYKVNFIIQFWWLLWRTFLATVRDPFASRIALIQTIVIAVIFGLVYLQLKNDQVGIQNINGVLFLLLTNNSFSNLFAVLNAFPAEIPIFMREHHNGMYSVLVYYLSKIVIDIPKFIFLPFLFTTIIYWMAGLNSGGSNFILCCVIIILVANAAVSFGNFLSALAPSATVALAISGPILVPLMVFSGFFLNNANVPSYFIWLKYLSWFNYSYELLILNQWSDVSSIKCSSNTTRCLSTGKEVISSLDLNSSNIATDYIALLCILFGYRILSYLILLIKSMKH